MALCVGLHFASLNKNRWCVYIINIVVVCPQSWFHIYFVPYLWSMYTSVVPIEKINSICYFLSTISRMVQTYAAFCWHGPAFCWQGQWINKKNDLYLYATLERLNCMFWKHLFLKIPIHDSNLQRTYLSLVLYIDTTIGFGVVS